MRDVLSYFEKPTEVVKFDAMRISIASPETILNWSYGEVKKPETINYRTFKPERDGLFCARIFGPIKDYECLCGKYKRMKHRGVVCDKCGVEVIQAKVRRERLGHINLATPVAHIWFLRSLPSRIGNLLDVSQRELEKVLYCEAFIVTDPKNTPLTRKMILSEDDYIRALEQFGEGSFEAGMGGEPILKLLETTDVVALSEEMRAELATTTSEAKRKKVSKRLKIAAALKDSTNKPQWMMLQRVPVLPPDLRPLVPLDGGRFATSDLNDLYRRVINRNNRLNRLKELNAPEIIVRNEKRMLQDAVDALFDNGRSGKTIPGSSRRPLRSLSDMLRGKTGRFRQNLLGKRVDYSGRSVIVVGPELKLHQCGLPKKMALELFKPFVFSRLIQRDNNITIKKAKKLVDSETEVVWDVLDEVIREHPVLLNRAPTLHRLGIQAFEPVLIEGKAIQLHPLVCTAFNADFDGDQMAVHVPLSIEAQLEARVLMMSTNNILSPAHGKPIINPSQDIVLGLYFMTRERPHVKGTGRVFANPQEVVAAYDHGEIDIQAKIKVRMRRGDVHENAGADADGRIMVDTVVGRIVLWEYIPRPLTFELINKELDKKSLNQLIDRAYRKTGGKTTVLLADRIRTVGYTQATRAGISIALANMRVPPVKQKHLNEALDAIRHVNEEVASGALSEHERRNKVIDIWTACTEKVAKALITELSTDEFVTESGEKTRIPSNNPIFIMLRSGARGSEMQVRQLAGMRGLMAKPSGEIIETPIMSSFREGLSVLEYFISTHGARKGLADTALKTANSGYLTRRLVDVAQDALIIEEDCGTMRRIEARALIQNNQVTEKLGTRILGRVSFADVLDPGTGEAIVEANEEITEDHVKRIEEAGIEQVEIRSVLTCDTEIGVCQKCYGRDLARGKMVNMGEAVGVIAAQSIGEPGTQLTMRTFHIGGAVSGQAEASMHQVNVTGVVSLRNVNVVKNSSGERIVISRNGQLVVVDKNDAAREREHYKIGYGSVLLVEDGQAVNAGDVVARWEAFAAPFIAETAGKVKFKDIKDGLSVRETVDEATGRITREVIESRDSSVNPQLLVVDDRGKVLRRPNGQEAVVDLPVGSQIVVDAEGQEVKAGDVIAKMPREQIKARDITGGLPRVIELFEARKPPNSAVVSAIEGVVSFGKEAKGKKRVIVTPADGVGKAQEYEIKKGRFLLVAEGDRVRAGEPLTDGPVNPHDILKILDEQALAKFLVDEIQQVYRLQGVEINDKHIEVIVRQMLRKVTVVDSGDTKFLADDHVDKLIIQRENDRVRARGGKPAAWEPLLLGIRKAALDTESFISAASFQETTKVLTEAALQGKVDGLRGLKENVIMGKLIPAGTGNRRYSQITIKTAGPDVAVIGGDESGADTGSVAAGA